MPPVKKKKLAQPKKPWDFKTKVDPGLFYRIDSNNIPTDFTELAKTFIPNDEKRQKAIALAAKIKEYEAQYKKLEAELVKTRDAKDDAEGEKEMLDTVDESTLKLFSYIEKNCSDIVAAMRASKTFLYRGMYEDANSVFVSHPRNDRRPKDSTDKDQEKFDRYLTLMGFTALRGNSIFCSGRKNQASGYGTIYAIFPKNGFDFTWSMNQRDIIIGDLDMFNDDGEDNLYSTIEYLDDYLSDLVDIVDTIVDEWVDAIADKATDGTYSKVYSTTRKKLYAYFNPLLVLTKKIRNLQDWNEESRIRKAIAGVQIFNMVDQYLQAPDMPKSVKSQLGYGPNQKKLHQKLLTVGKPDVLDPARDKQEAAKMVKGYKFRHDDIVAALKSGNEICVLGEYVAVNTEDEKYRDILTKYFLTPEPKKKTVKIKPKQKLVPYGDGKGGTVMKPFGWTGPAKVPKPVGVK